MEVSQETKKTASVSGPSAGQSSGPTMIPPKDQTPKEEACSSKMVFVEITQPKKANTEGRLCRPVIGLGFAALAGRVILHLAMARVMRTKKP